MFTRNVLVGVLGFGIVLLGGLVANAYTVPVVMLSGNITVGCERTPNFESSGYDLVEFYLTGMLGSAAGLNTDGTQVRINIIEGRWTAGNTGSFWFSTNKTQTTNSKWEIPPYSTVNFDSVVGGATVWTNISLGGGRHLVSGNNLFNFYSGSWYTTDYNADLTYPPYGDYLFAPTQSNYLAALFVTPATSNVGIGFGNIPFGMDGPGSGKFSFTYGGGIVENVAFYTIPEPGTMALLLAAVAGLVAYAWRRRHD